MSWNEPPPPPEQPPGGAPPPPWGQPAQPPPPYGQQPGYGPPPYGQPQYGPGPYGPPDQVAAPKGQAIGALIANIVAILCLCTPVGIVGTILSGMALSRMNTQPDSARNLLKWAWICFGASVVLGIAVWIFFISAGTFEFNVD